MAAPTTPSSLKAELHERGWRMTPQREKILQTFRDLPTGNHLSAEDLFLKLEQEGEPISLSTIYRTLKLMARIISPTSGTIGLNGKVSALLELGAGFHPDLSGRENIFLNGAILGMTKAEIRGKLDEIIAFAEVEKFIDTPVKHYSSGMYMRLAFAVAAHLDAEILVVDEVDRKSTRLNSSHRT